MLPTKFQVSQKEKPKIDFQDDGHLGYWIRTILAIFDLQVTPMLPTKFQINLPFGSGEEVKNRFSRWQPWQPSWISDQKCFSYCYQQVTPMLPSVFQVKWPFGSGEEVIRNILAVFDLNVIPSFLPSFKSTGLLVQQKKQKIVFQDGQQGQPCWISNTNDFSYF